MTEIVAMLVNLILTSLGAYLISSDALNLYHPEIYKDRQPFVFGALALSAFMTWVAFKFRVAGMLIVGACLVFSFVTVALVYEFASPSSRVHGWNWVLACLVVGLFA